MSEEAPAMRDAATDRPRIAGRASVALAFVPLAVAFFLLMIYLGAASGPSALTQQQAATVAFYGIPAMVVLSFIGCARAAAQSGKLRWFFVPLGGIAFAFVSLIIFVLTLVSH